MFDRRQQRSRQTPVEVMHLPELDAGFHLPYELKPQEARNQFEAWQNSHPKDALGGAAVTANYLFEGCYRHGVLTSEFCLNDKHLLGEVPLKPDSALREAFFDAIKQAQELAQLRLGTNGPCSAPAKVALEGASLVFQIGGQASDFVLLVMNNRGADSILTSQVKLSGDVAATAGPKGRNAAASTDITMRAEVLSYSRSRGLFAGISLEGSTLRPDSDGNGMLYGKGVSAKEIVINSSIHAPASAKLLVSTLNRRSPRNRSESGQLPRAARMVFRCA